MLEPHQPAAQTKQHPRKYLERFVIELFGDVFKVEVMVRRATKAANKTASEKIV